MFMKKSKSGLSSSQSAYRSPQRFGEAPRRPSKYDFLVKAGKTRQTLIQPETYLVVLYGVPLLLSLELVHFLIIRFD